MEKLSIEEKAKSYDEAIKKAESLYKVAEPMSGCNVIIETLFPELKDSEDERVRKRLLKIFREAQPTDNWGGLSTMDILAWLEKQGEIIKEWSEMKFNNIQTELQEMVDLKHKTEQGEQKFALSEEDECILNAIMHYLFTHGLRMWSDWLKSFKDRYTWKPSDEQMEALDDFIYAKYPNVEKYGAAIKLLYQDLKKLK